MHKTAMLRMKWFVDHYIPADRYVRVLDVGSYDVNGSYRVLFDGMDVGYVGLDISAGPNVDYVPKDPYRWEELEDGSFDFVISGNAFEHIEYPWLTIREIYRVLKEEGFACVLAPNSIWEHRHPVDCYRYFSDGFRALAKWGGFEAVDVTVSGVPAGASAGEYVSASNDTMMVLAKGIGAEKIAALPKFQYEKRYRYAWEWERRYHFLVKWCMEGDREGLLRSYLDRGRIRKLYLYGYSEIGRIIYAELKKIEGIEIRFIDRQAEKLSEIEAVRTGGQIEEGEDSFMLCTLLDDRLLDELDKIYPKIRKKYINDIFSA